MHRINTILIEIMQNHKECIWTPYKFQTGANLYAFVLNVWSLLVSVLRGQDPSVNVVLMEDLAAVIGVGVAGVCMGLTVHYGSPIPDAVGSLLVGGILGGVASFLIYTNVAALVGR